MSVDSVRAEKGRKGERGYFDNIPLHQQVGCSSSSRTRPALPSSNQCTEKRKGLKPVLECVHVCMYACMHVCIVCMYVGMYACTFVRMYVCTFVRMYVCMCVCACARQSMH